MNRLTAFATAILLLALSAPAWAQSWELSGLAAYTPSVALDRQAPELSATRHPGWLHLGRSRGAFVHAALGRGAAVDAAVIGAPDRHRGREARISSR